jgi:hypothetical protein
MATTRRSSPSVLAAVVVVTLATPAHGARPIAKYQEGYFRDMPGWDPQRI